MRMIKRRFLWFAAFMGAMLALPLGALAQTDDEEPIIVIKSRVHEVSDGAGVITITLGATEDGYIDVDAGDGPMEYEITQATIDTETGTFDGTKISCNVSSEGIVKIYGDASKIDVLSARECYITEVQIDKLKNLEILDLDNNEMTGLDLSGMNSLQYISVSNNPFNEKPLKIGADKPNLIILDMGRIENLDPSFNLSDYPALMTFDAWANKGLTHLDPTGCPELRKISIDATPVETLDVTKNKKLTILNISDTRIRNIDLSKNVYLNQFYVDHMSGSVNTDTKLEKLDVTHNPNLVYLFASGNGLTEIDLSKNPALQDLYINNNRLSSIDLSKNPNLYNVSLRNNNFTFATLPLQEEGWFYYAYQQNNMPVARCQKAGTVIDLSDKVLREGTVTTAALFKTNEANPNELTQLGSDYYMYEDGKVTLLKPVSDSVYLAFSNDAFPETALNFYPLCTNKFMVKSEADYGQDSKTISFNAPVMSSDGTPIAFGLGMYGATEAQPKKFYVDYGHGKVEYTATSENAPAQPNVTGGSTNSGTVTVYVPEGESVTAFDMQDVTLNSIDFSAARSLKTLRLVNAGLYSSDNINLKWNRMLRSLVLTGNHFNSLSIRGANDVYQKNLLLDIDLSNNELTNVTLNDMRTIRNLDLSNNKLTELLLKDADNMLTLDVSDNRLTEVDINYCTLMTRLDVARNNISSIVMPATNSLREVHCEYNALDFGSLPILDGAETYTFTPQNDITVAKIGPGCDLSRFNIKEAATTFVWKKADGTLLVRGTDYDEEGGVAHFHASAVGSMVYCEMTNPKFPGLVLKTSTMEAAAMPTNVIATFVTTEDQNGTIILRSATPDTPIYIDWTGNQAELTEYRVGDSPMSCSVMSHKGATVRVYTYSDTNDLTVFSVSGISMASINASKLTNLLLFGVQGAGLTEEDIAWPESKGLIEMRLADNGFSHIDLTRYPAMYDLDLNNNQFTSFDASKYPELQMLSLANNQLTSFKADNAKMWSLVLSGNQLEDVDLSKLPGMNQISLSYNRLSSIDVSAMKRLNVLYLDHNRFRPSTLPLNKFTLYTYGSQELMDIQAVDGVVDLSSEAAINDHETSFRWFIGEPSFDENGELVGEELYVDDEYLLENGVTTFTSPIDNVMCVLTNDEFPNAWFYTNLIDVTTTGINGTLTNGGNIAVTVSDHTVSVTATGDIPVRLVGMNGMLLRSDQTVNGRCTMRQVPAGTYLVVAGSKTYKIMVK